MSISVKITICLLILITLFASRVFAQNNNKSDEPISEEHYKILEQKKDAIEQEISSGKNEWTGVYSQGDHHPTMFMWSVNQGFLAWGSHHTFFPSRINFGKAEFSNDRLTIKPEINKEHLNFQHLPTELVPVKWGEQHFLIGSNELMEFAYAVHSGAESRIVNYFAKTEDYQKTRTGLPDLPKEYEKILTMKAISPKVTAFKAVGENLFEAEITLNLGRSSNAIEGMIFYYAKPSESLVVQIIELQEKTSKAKIVGIGGDKIKPKIGMKFTSKIPADYIDF